MYEVFIAGRSLLIRSREGAEVDLQSGHLHYHCSSADELQLLADILRDNDQIARLHAYHTDPDAIFDVWKERYKLIEAAGGLVTNDRGEYLFILRKGKWDLPKGKIDKGETKEKAAVREVAEECHVPEPELGNQLLTTYHVYELKGKSVLKPTYWFEMQLHGDHQPQPQVEEDITKAKWVPVEEIPSLMENTYPNIRILVEESIKLNA